MEAIVTFLAPIVAAHPEWHIDDDLAQQAYQIYLVGGVEPATNFIQHMIWADANDEDMPELVDEENALELEPGVNPEPESDLTLTLVVPRKKTAFNRAPPPPGPESGSPLSGLFFLPPPQLKKIDIRSQLRPQLSPRFTTS